jgi:hypothetical protein
VNSPGEWDATPTGTHANQDAYGLEDNASVTRDQLDIQPGWRARDHRGTAADRRPERRRKALAVLPRALGDGAVGLPCLPSDRRSGQRRARTRPDGRRLQAPRGWHRTQHHQSHSADAILPRPAEGEAEGTRHVPVAAEGIRELLTLQPYITWDRCGHLLPRSTGRGGSFAGHLPGRLHADSSGASPKMSGCSGSSSRFAAPS